MAKLDADLKAEIGGLGELATDSLRERWNELYGMPPTPRISKDLLARGIAFRIQEDAGGGVSKSNRKLLRRLREVLRDSGTIPMVRRRSFKAGTRLVREWKGKVYEVITADDATYMWAGKKYRSLSEIARAITGTRWSGPRFFGLETGQQTATATSIKDVPSKIRRRSQDVKVHVDV